MSKDLEDIIWDLNYKIQESLEKNGFMIVGNSYLQENVVIQIKKNNEIFDVDIFGDVDEVSITEFSPPK